MSTRAWFRTEEVHPIAEHAIACPAHRITTAQVRAGFPLRPALIWTATTERVALSSNGVPAWYDEDGQDHDAPAWTWQHRPTGRHGVAILGFDTAYLPLTSAGSRPPVIEALRDGQRAGGHWVVVDLDAAGGHVIGPRAVRLVDHRDEIAPPEATWQPATVTAAAVAHGVYPLAYPALVADGYTVRGDDVLARFDRATVEQMADDLRIANAASMPGEIAILRFDGDVLLVLWEHDDGLQTRQREIDRVYPDPDGFFSVGAYLWPWMPAEAPR